VVDGAPETVLHPVDLHESFVEMPLAMPKWPHRLNAVPSDLGRENCSEPVPAEPHRLMRDVDATLVEQVLDVPQ